MTFHSMLVADTKYLRSSNKSLNHAGIIKNTHDVITILKLMLIVLNIFSINFYIKGGGGRVIKKIGGLNAWEFATYGVYTCNWLT